MDVRLVLDVVELKQAVGRCSPGQQQSQSIQSSFILQGVLRLQGRCRLVVLRSRLFVHRLQGSSVEVRRRRAQLAHPSFDDVVLRAELLLRRRRD